MVLLVAIMKRRIPAVARTRVARICLGENWPVGFAVAAARVVGVGSSSVVVDGRTGGRDWKKLSIAVVY